MTADTMTTLARTPVAATGYPTDLTPRGAQLTATGQLYSWADGLAAATDLLAAGNMRERTDAALWVSLVEAAKRYADERAGGPANVSASDLVYVVTIMIENARTNSR